MAATTIHSDRAMSLTSSTRARRDAPVAVNGLRGLSPVWWTGSDESSVCGPGRPASCRSINQCRRLSANRERPTFCCKSLPTLCVLPVGVEFWFYCNPLRSYRGPSHA